MQQADAADGTLDAAWKRQSSCNRNHPHPRRAPIDTSGAPSYSQFLRVMRWLELKIRQYEHGRWATDDNRRVLPFHWGLEYLGGRADEPDPRAVLDSWGGGTLGAS